MSTRSFGSWQNATVASSSRSGPRAYVPPAILNELQHFDLSRRVILKGTEVVGLGAYGDVLKSTCTFENRKEVAVAVKRLRFYLKEDIESIFQKEIYVWSKLNHDNVLALLGFAFDESTGYPLLISEWMANGSSWNYVKRNSDCDLMRLILGIAKGLAYLHDNNIVHSDIKPDNIVITDAGDARICDFGGSRLAAASRSIAKPSTGIRGTSRYLSYELVALSDQYPCHTKESDVWAFGMTVFALIAQEHPYALYGDAQVSKAIADHELPQFNFWTTLSSEEKAILRNVCFLSWDHEPKQRANMPYIVTILRDFGRGKCMSRPLCELDSNGGDTKCQGIVFSESLQAFSGYALAQGVKKDQFDQNRSLIRLTMCLEHLFSWVDSQSEVYQHLKAAWKVSLSLYNVVPESFQFDGKLEHLMRAIYDAFNFIQSFLPLTTQGQRHNTIRLLQQTIECCLFVYRYTQLKCEECLRFNKTIADFISFFVSYKDTLASGSSIGPGFISSRSTHPIDDFVLRQRLTPSETSAVYQPTCLIGTRVEVQEQIIDWILSPSNQHIFWLHGAAGSGKSTISASIADHFRGIYRLGACLSFKRGKSDPAFVICTIAFKLALFDSTIGSLILAETERNKDIITASLLAQFEKLLMEPLIAAADAQLGPVAIILDALDECGTPETREPLIRVLQHGLSRLPPNFRFLITSRRERDIDRAFSSQTDTVRILELDYTSNTSRLDVKRYMELEIRRILENEGDIPDDESLRKHLSLLWNSAAGLFVWASTIIKLISESDTPFQRLRELASSPRSLQSINQLYTTVLRCSGISWNDNTSKTRFSRIVGLVLLSKETITESTIDGILGPTIGKCHAMLSRLRSVIDYRPGEPIRLFHTSFSDYLMSCNDTEDWFIDIPVQESFLAMRCLDVMKDELRFNICDLNSSFIRNVNITDLDNRIKEYISAQASYACCSWSRHLCEASYELALMQALSEFLYNRLLYWLEVLALLKKVDITGPMLLATTKWVRNNDAEVVTFLKDAWRLINIFNIPISQSTPHIYISMLPLAVDESSVSSHYLQCTSSLVRVTRRGGKHQSPLLKLLEGHKYSVNTVVFSPDGSLIASGSDDRTVRIWGIERGELIAGPFDGHVGYISSISFSPDGTRISVGGSNGIAVLDAACGKIEAGPFEDKYTRSIAFSTDGKHIASVSSDSVKIWSVESGKIFGKPFAGDNDHISCVAFSRNGRLVSSGSRDGSVHIWYAESGELVRGPFLGHRNGVHIVALSPDGRQVVFYSYYRFIGMWNVETGEVCYIFPPEDEIVTALAYSSEGTRIVSSSYKKFTFDGGYKSEIATVRIWDGQNGQLVAGPFKHTNPVFCVAFSPDRTRVVSGSDVGTLQIWDAVNGKVNSGPEPIRNIEAVRLSADSSCVISNDGTTWCIEDGSIIPNGSGGSNYRTLTVTNSMQFMFSGTLEWNHHTGRVTSCWNGYWDFPNCIAVSPSGKRFAFGSGDRRIRIWDGERDELVCGPFDGQGEVINFLVFSPDGTRIASGSNKDVRVWDSETGVLLFDPFTRHNGYITCVAFSPDGRHIASDLDEGKVIILDLESGSSKTFGDFFGGIRSVSFSADGSHIVSSDVFSEIRIWSMETTSGALAPTNLDQLLPSGAGNSIDLSNWTLDEDGWIRGAHGELVIWVPPDLRSTLCLPPCIAIFNDCDEVGFSTTLDFSDCAYGEHWYTCFSPLLCL